MALYQLTRPSFFKSWVSSEYHKHYVHDSLHRTVTWQGTPIVKNPFDLVVYQELIHELKPDVIVECGTFRGGSTVFFSDMCRISGGGSVVSVDIEARDDRPQRDNISYVIGSSVDEDTVAEVRSHIKPDDTVMVILDADHSKEHVLSELEVYSDLVTVGNYLIVEDTDINGHPVKPGWGPGPMEAVQELLETTDKFVVDKEPERFSVTFCPNGFLKKVQE